MMLRSLKTRIQKSLGRIGYEIHRARPHTVPINILPMVIRNRMETRNSSTPFSFIEVGAHDGLHYDPIRKFITAHHWRGILVEPQPKVFAQLVRNYKSEPQLIFENVALGSSDGNATLYTFKTIEGMPDEVSMLASFNRNMLTGNGFGYQGEIEELRVPTMTAASLLSKHGISELDLLQVDTEGFDYEVIKMFLQTGVKPAIISYESACLDAESLCQSLSLLTTNGYRLLPVGIDTVAYLQEDDDDAFLVTTEDIRELIRNR